MEKIALVTGSSRGIGRAVAAELARQGWAVCINYRVREDCARSLLEQLTAEGCRAMMVQADVSQRDQVTAMVRRVEDTFGPVSLLVNNAGVLDSGLDAIEKISDETIDRLVDTNTKGTLYLTREAAKVLMAKKRGSIVNVASVAGYCGNGGAAYVASKASIIGLTKNIAMRGAAVNVRCNAVCPGTVVTPMTAGLNPANLDPDMMGAMAKHADLTLPVCQPDDVANLLLFLASDESKAVTGQVLVIDYGANL